jgi:protein tyrosine kinase modulator
VTAQDILSILKKRYWVILVGALVAGIAAAILSFVWPPSYEARSLLLITKLRPSVTLDARYQTVAEENVVNLSVQEEQVRRQTLVALATGGALVQQVLDRLGTELPPEEQTRSAVLNMVDVGTEGNLVSITARAGDPERAAAIANAWASVYQETVNRLYSTISPSNAEIQAQVQQARASYDEAQQELQAFLQVSQENELLRQIEQKQQLLADLQAVYLSAVREQAAQLLARQGRIARLLLDVQSLRAQLAGASPSDPLTPGEQLGLLSVEALAFAQGEVLSASLELAPGWQGDAPRTAGQAITHLDRLVETLHAGSTNTQAALDALSRGLLSGEDLLIRGSGGQAVGSIAELQSAINDLQSKLEHETIKKADLTNASDLAQQSYLTLMRKATEVQIASATTGVEVQVASSAQVPEEPAFPRPLRAIVLGLLAGALAGLALVFLIELWPRTEAKAAA